MNRGLAGISAPKVKNHHAIALMTRMISRFITADEFAATVPPEVSERAARPGFTQGLEGCRRAARPAGFFWPAVAATTKNGETASLRSRRSDLLPEA
ncbi:hypothetical protein [Nevskia sp.]|uniref:hypothetical protein n=1 Tax=Nevskia sp. TaxID=1929292 RepID=UPI0025E75343|nr:hypothetical protein [Nevskia sp.]